MTSANPDLTLLNIILAKAVLRKKRSPDDEAIATQAGDEAVPQGAAGDAQSEANAIGGESYQLAQATISESAASAESAASVATATPAAAPAIEGILLTNLLLAGAVVGGAAALTGGNSGASPAATAPADTTAPAITHITITAAGGMQHGILKAGDVVSVTVTLSEATTVTTTDGTPQLALTIGGTTVQANYVSGSGSTALVFSYTVQAGQTDANGISIAANGLSLNGGTLTDAAGNAATLGHTLVADNAAYLVDAIAPTLTISSNVAALSAGSTAAVTFTFSEAPTGFDASDITATGGTLSALAVSATDPTVYTATFTPTADTAANASITVAAASYSDAAGNNGGAGATAAISIDTTLHNIVDGLVTAGPVIPGNGLTVYIYKAGGTTLLGSGRLNSAGQFHIDVGSYTGAVIAKVLDTNAGADYVDEATGLGKDLNATLMAVAVVTGGVVTLNINPVTTIAAIKAGMTSDGSGSVSAASVTEANTAVGAAFGLGNITTIAPVLTVSANGQANPDYNPNDGLSAAEKYGAVLAVLSGNDRVNVGNTQATLNQYAAAVTGTGTDATLNITGQSVFNDGIVAADQRTAGDLSVVFETRPVFSIAANGTAQQTEGDNPYLGKAFNFTITRSSGNVASTVDYVVAGVTGVAGAAAAANSDFGAGTAVPMPHGTVSFAIGETSKTIPIDVAGDTVPEHDDIFSVTLQKPSNAALGNITSVQATILNDDRATSAEIFSNLGYYNTFFNLSLASYIQNIVTSTVGMSGKTTDLQISGLANAKSAGLIMLTDADIEPHGTGDLKVAFKDGYYVGYTEHTYNFDYSAVATIARSADALFLTFRGTSQGTDWLDNLAYMTGHYNRYQPLFDSIETYLKNTSDIKKIYVSGHSLGGQMAAMYMDKHPDSTIPYEAVTFEAANKLEALSSSPFDGRFINFEMRGDPVPDLGVGANYGRTVHVDYEDAPYVTSHLLDYIGEDLKPVISHLHDEKVIRDTRIYVDSNDDGVIVTNYSSPYYGLDAAIAIKEMLEVPFLGPILATTVVQIASEDNKEYGLTTTDNANNYRYEFAWENASRHTVVLRPLGTGKYALAADSDIDNLIVSNDSWSPSETFDINAQAATHQIFLIGNDAKNTLVGSGYDDVIIGSGGVDILIGGAGCDQLYGADYRDVSHIFNVENKYFDAKAQETVNAYAGTDRFDSRTYQIGGAGADCMTGSDATDYFFVDYFKNDQTQIDTIYGFNSFNGSDSDYFVFSAAQLGIKWSDIGQISSLHSSNLFSKPYYELSSSNFQNGSYVATHRPTFFVDGERIGFDADGSGSGAKVTLANVVGTMGWFGGISSIIGNNVLIVENFDELNFDQISVLDTIHPTLAITSNVAAVKTGDTAGVTFTFSEAPTGFTASDITTTGGTLSDSAVSATDPKVYTATFTPAAGTTANASIVVAAGSYTDAAGNNGAAGGTPTIAIDTISPTLTITDTTPGTATGPVVYGFTFSEPVTGFTADDVVTPGVKAELIQTDSSHYTVTVIPPAGSGTMQVGVNAGAVTDLAGNANALTLSDAQAYAPAPAAGGYVPGQDIIDLGTAGKLIAPVQVEGNWYYYWDLSGDGTSSDTGIPSGSFNGGIDQTRHDMLDRLFNYDINGDINRTVVNGDGAYGTTDTYRYATISGVSLALPTIGGQGSAPYGAYGLGERQPGTAVNSGTTTNTIYNDLLAIWDAYNGSGTGFNINGIPPGWIYDSYWSATPYYWGHAYQKLNGGVGGDSDITRDDGYSVALQVLSPYKTAPTFTTSSTSTIAENTLISVTVYDATADGDVGVAYTLAGSDAALFNIAPATGVVTFKFSPNFESPLDVGANNVYDFTIIATFTDTSNNATAKPVQLSVTDVSENSYVPGQGFIDLGIYGKLIAPVQVEGNWYYFWDRSGDSIGGNDGRPSGSLNGGLDSVQHDVLDGLFNHDINGDINNTVVNADGGYGTTDTYRYATINGVSLALPTIGGQSSPPYGSRGIDNYQLGTAVSSGATTNPTYNDLLAVWDAYNGSGTVNYINGIPTGLNGTPAGWNGGLWAATPSPMGHVFIGLDNGSITDRSADAGCVALQVL